MLRFLFDWGRWGDSPLKERTKVDHLFPNLFIIIQLDMILVSGKLFLSFNCLPNFMDFISEI